MSGGAAARVALITGCSSGIGRECALALRKLGWTVYATVRNETGARDLQAAGVLPHVVDMRDSAGVALLAARIEKECGRLDVLINNAGYGLFSPLLDVSEAAIEDQFKTNVFAPLKLIQATAPLMRRTGAVVANIGSISGVVPTPFAGAYCASKAAINMLSNVLRLELAPFGIHVVCVQPGAIRSSFGANGSASAKTVPEHSWYAPIQVSIMERANASQESAMPAEEFAARLVKELLRPSPPAVLRIGPKSRLLPLMWQCLPSQTFGKAMLKKYGLLTLQPGPWATHPAVTDTASSKLD